MQFLRETITYKSQTRPTMNTLSNGAINSLFILRFVDDVVSCNNGCVSDTGSTCSCNNGCVSDTGSASEELSCKIYSKNTLI